MYGVIQEFTVSTKKAKFIIPKFSRVKYENGILEVYPLLGDKPFKYLHGSKLTITLIEWNKIKQNLK